MARTGNGFTLRQVELFAATARAGSFAAAADEQFVTATAIASAVGELERSFGVQLFRRRRAEGVVLTPAGTHLMARVGTLLREAAELQFSMRSADGELRGPVSIGCYSALSPTVLPALIESFRSLHPGIDLNIVDGPLTELIERLELGTLDLAIGYRISLPPTIEDAVLYETSVHVLLSGSHRLAHAPTVSLHDLADEPLVLLDMPPSAAHTLDLLRTAGVSPVVAVQTSNFELVRSLVGRGLGYSLLVQRPPIGTSYEGLPVVAKRITPAPPSESAVIMWPRGIRLSERARTLADHALATVGRTQWTPGSGVD